MNQLPDEINITKVQDRVEEILTVVQRSTKECVLCRTGFPDEKVHVGNHIVCVECAVKISGGGE